jgi:hypothetical protein
VFVSCSDKNQFSIKGNVKEGAGKTLYLENITASSMILLDSTVLAKDGSFKFKRKRPDAPDFYRLRLNKQIINLAVDSTETIFVQSDTVSFARNYTLENSAESEKIKDLTFLQLSVNESFNKLQRDYKAQKISLDELQEKTKEVIDSYKTKAKEYIFSNPASAVAYFALFQQINDYLIFDPYDRNDSKVFGAVANNWHVNYPKASRTKHLVELFTNSLKIMRNANNPYTAKEIESKDYFDIFLPAINDKEIRLSEIGAGKLVLLDFTAYELKDSPAHNVFLADFYNKYSKRGFEIYQVSFDGDRHFWKNAADNLPWICVIDPESVYSELLKKYNVSKIPAGFLFDRKGNIVSRIEDYKQLEKIVLSNM